MDYIIQTPCGALQGTAGRVPGTVAYKGIRYATAGRWEYPVQVTSWEGVYDATAYGHCSYQARAFYNEEDMPEKAFYYNEFRKGETYTYSEDCLFLNIFTPETAKEGDKLPVLVYIHGGGFTGGCGHEKHFDGPEWPAQGIIGVTLNYRLGPMGFLCLPELKQEAGHTGNYGLFDQMTALSWVRDNIAAFGGDVDNITIMGQSAGAASVQLLSQSPMTEGMFSRAVMSSGCGLGTLMGGFSPEKSYDFWHAVMERCGCATVDDFRKLSPQVLFAEWQKAKKDKDLKGGASATSPVIDGLFNVKDAKPHNIPYMAGSTSHDVMPPILYAMGKDFCAKREKNSYFWFFDRMLPGDDNGAWHSADLWYWFGTLDNCWRPMEQKDYALSRQMVQYLMNFCKYADPNGAGLTAWLPMGKKQGKVLRLGEEATHMGRASLAKLTYTLATNKAVGE